MSNLPSALKAWTLIGLLAAPATLVQAQLAQEWRDLVPQRVAAPSAGVLPDQAFEQVRDPDAFQLAWPGERAWHQAAAAGRWDEVLKGLQADALDPNRPSLTGHLVLNQAIRDRQLAVVRALVKKGASANLVSGDGFTALGLAAFLGEVPVVRLLLKAGADPKVMSLQGQAPIHLAAAAGQAEVLAVLWPLTPPDWPNAQGRHALAEAALNGQVGAMDQIKGWGFDPATLDAHGLDAVHAAVLGRSQAALDWLAQQGLQPQHAVTVALLAQWQAGLNPPLHTLP